MMHLLLNTRGAAPASSPSSPGRRRVVFAEHAKAGSGGGGGGGGDGRRSVLSELSVSKPMIPMIPGKAEIAETAAASDIVEVRTVGHDAAPTARFEIGRALGKGAFGMVFLARECETGFVCALKRIRKRKVLSKGAQALRNIRREIEIHARLSRDNHRHFVRFYNYFYDDKSIYMAMEYAIGGELKRALDRHVAAHGRGFSERRVAVWMQQLAGALAHMHGMNITHRDIEPENILLGADNEIKLTDFGWSIRSARRRETLCGTPDYLSPELVFAQMGRRGGSHGSRSAGFDLSVDLWACGVLAFELLVGDAPFSWTPEGEAGGQDDEDDEDDDLQDLFDRIRRVDIRWPAGIISRYPRDFIASLLRKNPKQRMAVARWVGHPWFMTSEKKERATSKQKHDSTTATTDNKNKNKKKEKKMMIMSQHRHTKSQENLSAVRNVYN